MSSLMRKIAAWGWLERVRSLLWTLLLISVPVTSFPYFPEVLGLGGALVRPLALYPLIILVLIEAMPSLLRSDAIPAAMLPLFGFVLLALVGSFVNLLDAPFPLGGTTPLSRTIRAYATLGIGLCFLFVCWRMSSREGGIEKASRGLVLGGAVAVGWGSVQGLSILTGWPNYEILNILHRSLSVRDMHSLRATGLAYEPSWFADFLVVILIPLLIAALISGQRILPGKRWGKIGELALLIAAVINLMMTYSRGGFIVFLVSMVVIVALEAASNMGRIRSWFRGEDVGSAGSVERRRTRLVRGLGSTGGGALLLMGVSWILSQNVYFKLLWTRLGQISNLVSYFLSIGSGPRLALWQSALGVFLHRPMLGAGLGLSGFWMWDFLPNWIFNRQSEILETFTSATAGYPNPKNLWIRLLAETGVVGTVLFLAFLLLVALQVFTLYRTRERMGRFCGIFGMMSLTAIVLEGFSLDSFANPTLWIPLGLILGAMPYVSTITDEEAADA